MSNSETSAFSPNDAQLRAFWIIFAPVLRRAGGSGPEFGMRFSAVHAVVSVEQLACAWPRDHRSFASSGRPVSVGRFPGLKPLAPSGHKTIPKFP
jgi:hypothetical protein